MTELDPERLLDAAKDGALRELLRAAQGDEAPARVREGLFPLVAATFGSEGAGAHLPLSTVSGVFEKKPPPEAESCEPTRVHAVRIEPPLLEVVARPGFAAQLVLGNASVLQLAAAVLLGIAVSKGAHLAARAFASRQQSATVAAAGVRVNQASVNHASVNQASVNQASVNQAELGAVQGARESGRTNDPRRGEPRSADLELAELESNDTRSEAEQRAPARSARRDENAARSLRPRPSASSIDARAGMTCGVACSTQGSGEAPDLRRLEGLALEPTGAREDDWLGEQLGLLSRAERSLLEGNSAEALRLLDDYQARFPRGLLDPEVGALRGRAAEDVDVVILP